MIFLLIIPAQAGIAREDLPNVIHVSVWLKKSDSRLRGNDELEKRESPVHETEEPR